MRSTTWSDFNLYIQVQHLSVSWCRRHANMPNVFQSGVCIKMFTTVGAISHTILVLVLLYIYYGIEDGIDHLIYLG